jgi:hypothetical protein
VSGTTKNIGNDTKITQIGLSMAQILSIKVLGQQTVQMKPRVKAKYNLRSTETKPI